MKRVIRAAAVACALASAMSGLYVMTHAQFVASDPCSSISPDDRFLYWLFDCKDKEKTGGW